MHLDGQLEEELRFCWALVWHPVHSFPSPTTTTRTLPRTRQRKHSGSYNASVRPCTKACKAYNQGKCGKSSTDTNHQHICAYCLVAVKQEFPHLEEEYNRKKGAHVNNY